MFWLDERHRPDAQIAASRKEAGKPAISVHGSGIQPGQNATIIGVVRQKSAQKAEKWGFPLEIGMLPSRKLKIC